MKEQVNSDLEKYTAILNGLDRQLVTLVLTDIIAKLSSKEENANENNYEEFDTLTNEIKAFLNNVNFDSKDIPNIKESIKDTLENNGKMYDECIYSIRILEWVKNMLDKEEVEQ